eukprot:432745-Rhodomonas_salina.1
MILWNAATKPIFTHDPWASHPRSNNNNRGEARKRDTNFQFCKGFTLLGVTAQQKGKGGFSSP